MLAIGGRLVRSGPARDAALPNLRVAAIQGDIPQSIKHDPAAIQMAIQRYEQMTVALVPNRPALVLWPETGHPRST